MCYCGNNQYPYQYPYEYDEYENENYGACPIYPVPFMPVNPMYAHAYVPYQTYRSTYSLEEAMERGTLFPELANVYNPYEDYRKVGK